MISPVETWIADKTGIGQALGPDSLLEYQLAGIRKALNYVQKESRFYRERLKGLNFENIPSLEDFQKLPFTFPEDIQREPLDFLCVDMEHVERIITLHTSGTTGPSKKLFFTRSDMESTVEFYSTGIRAIVPDGSSVGVFMDGSRPDTVGDLLKRGLSLRNIDVTVYGFIEDYPDAAAFAERFDCLMGIPSQMLHLARLYPGLRPQSILLSGDYVPVSITGEIKRLWKCRIFNHYGLTETAYGAGVQCDSEEGLHMREADIFTEIVDPVSGRSVPDGEFGEVVLTTFSNRAMPLIRYRTGDISRKLTGKCPCGGCLPRLDRIAGRKGDVTLLKNGGILNIHELDELVFSFSSVRDYVPVLRSSLEGQVLELHLETDGSENDNLMNILKERLGGILPLGFCFETLNNNNGYSKRKIILGEMERS